MTFYQASCSRCHGAFGAMYADTFLSTGETKLRDNVARMVTGPGQSHRSETELASLVAFHRSLVKEEPFVIVTHVDEGQTVEGEATPGARVILTTPTDTVEAVMDGCTWRVTVACDAGGVENGTVRVEYNGKSASCPIKSGASSHDAPLPRE